MEKRIWSKPEMHEFAFAANEYVAACGDENRVFKFICDAAAGVLFYYKNWAVQVNEEGKTNKPSSFPKRMDLWGNSQAGTTPVEGFSSIGYHPCGETHEASVTDDFYWGFVDRNGNVQNDGDEETVIVWKGADGNNGHATTNLDMNSWITAKS